MVEIVYFVHSITFDNEQGIATGWLPGELSPDGIKRAHKLAEDVRRQHFDVVISSDLKRAVDTAQIVFGDRHTILQDKRLREITYGDHDGTDHRLFKAHPEDFIDKPFPGGESYRDVEKRIRSLCKELRGKYDGKRVAFVSHGAPQQALEVITKGKTWEQAMAEDWRRTKAFQPGWVYTIP